MKNSWSGILILCFLKIFPVLDQQNASCISLAILSRLHLRDHRSEQERVSLCILGLQSTKLGQTPKKRLQKRDGCSWKTLRGVGSGQGTRRGSKQGPDLSLGGWGLLTAFSRLTKGICRSLGTTGLDRIKFSLPFFPSPSLLYTFIPNFLSLLFCHLIVLSIWTGNRNPWYKI